MTRRSLLGIAAVACGVALAGLPPSAPAAPSRTPVQPVSDLAARYQAAHRALAAGNCWTWNTFLEEVAVLIEPATACTADTRRRKGGLQVRGARGYGTGAVIDYVSGESPGGGSAIFALWRDRRFDLVIDEPLGPQIGTRPTPRARYLFERTLRSGIRALRVRDCRAYFAVFTVFTADRGRECSTAFAGALAGELRANPSVRITRLGGTRSIQLFGVFTEPGHYRTMVVTRLPAARWAYQIAPAYWRMH
jgi:hypothetical protein